MPSYYEFFAGGGMARAGLGEKWTCAFANDFSPEKARSYEANWGKDDLVVEDINNLNVSQLPGLAGLAWASFPCQDLSLAGNQAGLRGERSGSFWGFWELIRGLNKQQRKPSTIVLENVYGTLTSHGGEDFQAIAKAVAAEGYVFGALVVDAVHFVPQSRPRVFIVCVDERLQMPEVSHADRPTPAWHSEKVIGAYNGLPKRVKSKWRWWNLPDPTSPLRTLEELVEPVPVGVRWHTKGETTKLLNMMTPLNRSKVLAAQVSGRLAVGMIYKRTRNGVQCAEVRFDGIAGCLRTPAGGSSRQTVMIVEGPNIRSRLISPREGARLMGLPDTYQLPTKYNEAYHLVGDGVVVPVVSHISHHILLPILQAQPQGISKAA